MTAPRILGARILGAGLLGPGLPSWRDGGPILAGGEAFVPGEVEPPAPAKLTSRERRRTSFAVRLALAVAEEAVEGAAVDPKTLPSVFGWAHGDGAVVQKILEVLASSERHVSPTSFHNSVHNVAVGYWTIMSGSHEPSSSIAAAEDTFPAGLLKALAQVQCEQRPVLLAVCDSPFPEPLNSVCEVGAPFGFALVLAPPDHAGGLAGLSATYRTGAPSTLEPPSPPELQPLWAKNPAARALPLLQHLARGEAAALQVPYGSQGHLDLLLEQ